LEDRNPLLKMQMAMKLNIFIIFLHQKMGPKKLQIPKGLINQILLSWDSCLFIFGLSIRLNRTAAPFHLLTTREGLPCCRPGGNMQLLGCTGLVQETCHLFNKHRMKKKLGSRRLKETRPLLHNKKEHQKSHFNLIKQWLTKQVMKQIVKHNEELASAFRQIRTTRSGLQFIVCHSLHAARACLQHALLFRRT